MTVKQMLAVVDENTTLVRWEDNTGSYTLRSDWLPKEVKIKRVSAVQENFIHVELDMDFETGLLDIL